MEAGKEDAAIYDSLHSTFALLSRGEKNEGTLVAEAMRVGANGVAILAALDGAHTSRFGVPTPTPVNHAPVAGPAILISGHDMTDLSALLEQSAGKGVNVYTHGEMLPAHGYPKLRAHSHLKGHFGTAWQLQKLEYGAFPGPVVQTTNCLIEPRKSYQDRLFTTNATAFPGVTHIPRGGGHGGAPDFSPVIARALSMKGFPETKVRLVILSWGPLIRCTYNCGRIVRRRPFTQAPKNMLTGFGHDAVVSVAPAVLDAVSKGQLDRFVLIGGCDGSEVRFIASSARVVRVWVASVTVRCFFAFGDCRQIAVTTRSSPSPCRRRQVSQMFCRVRVISQIFTLSSKPFVRVHTLAVILTLGCAKVSIRST